MPLKRLVGAGCHALGARVPWHALLAPRRRSGAEVERVRIECGGLKSHDFGLLRA
jgi:hypothetical protein